MNAPARALRTRPRRRADPVDQSALQRLVGYNCRRAYLAIFEHSMRHMAAHDLRPTSFSVLALVHRNPGVNSRQVSQALGVRPPNLVSLIASFEERGLLERRRNPEDGRSLGLHLTAEGRRLVTRVEREVARAEIRATAMLSAAERRTLIGLLTRIYAKP